jgi:hypothetical protein
MNIPEIVKSCDRPYLRNECELIWMRDELGMSLKPSRLHPIVTCGADSTPGFSLGNLLERDRESSRWYINWLDRLQSEYPEIAAEFCAVLNKAELVWRDCIAA